MSSETIHQRDQVLVRRTRLAPGESTAWHQDPEHRVSVVLAGEALMIEYRDGSPAERVEVRPGEVGWDEPNRRLHRAVNVGAVPYEEVTVVLAHVAP